MKIARFIAFAAVLCTLAMPAYAQAPVPVTNPESGDQVPANGPTPPAADEGAPDQLQLPAVISPVEPNPAGFRLFASDFKHFFRKDTGQVLGMMAIASIAVTPWDLQGINNGFNFSTRNLRPGNAIGGVYVQGALGLAAYGVGRASGDSKMTNFGRDVVRAQLLSQALVQGMKFTVRRERPDGSNRTSFPSGHTASTFATAAVVHRYYGWKAGVPAYAVGVYVASARMAWNKHHISDVVMGAGFGLAAGRTVTMKMAGSKFTMGVAPTVGGGMVTITKK